MQKNRNRTFKNNFEFSKEFLQSLPNLEKLSSNTCDQVINEKQKLNQSAILHEEKQHAHSSSSFDCDSLTNESDLDIVSFGKSSSSSISWSEDFDSEATLKVQNELERMERILLGKEAIPLHYNKDEYTQWIDTFPKIRIIEDTSNTPTREIDDIGDHFGDTYQFRESNEDCSNLPIVHIKPGIVEPVRTSDRQNLTCKSNLRTSQSNLTNSSKLKEFLKVSPILLEESGCRSNYLSTRQQSSHSISQSEKLSMKWMRGDAPHDYSSLPYVSSAKSKVNNSTIRKKSDKFKHLPNISPYKSNCVSLPPIKTLSFPSANQHRPSLTPRIQAKSTSSATIPVEVKIKRSKYLYKICNCDAELISFRKLQK
ncbi:hypothetical protein RI129_000878 [Pyrocoelia pectoralis]|uniref:Uncharacterized protein n=1 Tax=Pyrocoelia pectoralis TaxID=417401 RepID=A0AAN7VWA7_9COLE